MLGELDEAGNTTTLAHYADLLSGVGLIGNVQKYAAQKVRQKGSSPKFCVYNTALMTAQSNTTYQHARADHQFWGRLVESSVGAYLLNSARGTQVEVFYWREGDKEVDFVLRRGTSITALEVKSGAVSRSRAGMTSFVAAFNPSRILLVGEQGLPLEEFFHTSILDIV